MSPKRLIVAVAAFVVVSGTLLSTAIAQRATTCSIHGHVADSATHEALAGVRVELRALHRGATTDLNGDYEIRELAAGPLEIEIHLIGYRVLRSNVTLAEGDAKRLDYLLVSQSVGGEEVIVQSDRDRELERTSVSSIRLNPKLIAQVPAIGGETDLFRVLQLLPGVKALSEVSSGLYVRGGAPDQNLILLDDNVIYNPTHLFGFFSTFNTDAIKDVNLIKGGYPAEFGGRLTSVLDVTTREGNTNGVHGKTSIGFISARQTLEFPLLNGSVLVSGRRTYIDAFLDITNADSWLGGGSPLPRYYFYDLNAKIDQSLGENDKLSLSGYYGADHLHYPSNGLVEINLSWGNRLASGEWTHLFSPEFFSKTFLGYTYYASQSIGKFTSNPYEFDNGIEEASLKETLDWKVNSKNDIRAGFELSRFTFNLFNVLGSTNKPLKDTGGSPRYFSGFVQNEWHPTSRLTANYGLRSEWIDGEDAITVDPRVTLSYQLDPNWSIKASTGIYHQFLHLVSVGEFTFFDLWVPGTSPLPPSMSTQYILGISGYPLDEYFVSLEGYYKDLRNIVEYNETKFQSNDIRQVFPIGTGKAYGVELYLQKRIGDVAGWIGYTLSWVRNRFDSLNNGLPYSPKYDQRHDIQFLLSYKLTDRWQAGLTWTYATGQAYTSTLGYYHVGFDETGFQSNLEIPGYLGDQRLPAYHRADASLTYSFSFFGNAAKASLDIFNIYSHRNVWFRAVDTGTQPVQISDVLLLPIVPTLGMEVTY